MNDGVLISAPNATSWNQPVERFLGIDVGTETLKILELVRRNGILTAGRRFITEHGKNPGPVLIDLLQAWDWDRLQGAAASGRLSRLLNLPRVPMKQAQGRGYRYLFKDEPATIVSIGNHGFSVLELRGHGIEVFRENSRCSQGTGNFLRQLVERFSLSIEEASELCAEVQNPAPLSGRCPVILKTDMTHLANKGEDRAQILAGLFDAVCQNVLVLIKPALNPGKVLLIGGVSRSRRVQQTFRQALVQQGMMLVPLESGDALFLEALGDAVIASEQPATVPPLEQLLVPPHVTRFERSAPLGESLIRVKRMTTDPAHGSPCPSHADVILGFDIGSTGSKLVAFGVTGRQPVWEGYQRTSGDPVGAAQSLWRQYRESRTNLDPVRALGVTGSGREIVGSLLASCYGSHAVFILNEIAAHAEGALHFDRRVDTIFEIGGQDAKYIRLADQRVIDCAMNEACSAGTGSFIEEQGRKFSGIRDVAHLAQEALAATSGVSLGQHCSVFMAEVIDESVAAGVDSRAIIAGLYDSIVQNYLHRVKGNRSVGQVVFCQGMPFSADALAAAVARQTGSEVIVPPNPGTVGALGIALLAEREIQWQERPSLDATLFLGARLEQRETFVCKANAGCGGAGNKCRIDCIRTSVAGQRQRFTWGGACSLYDRGARRKKLPDRSPDPFREREELIQVLARSRAGPPGCRRIGITDEFALKGLFPFFATFLCELGFDLVLPGIGDQAALRRGIAEANVPFCAPMQLYHGIISRMADQSCDFLFVPMIRNWPRLPGEPEAVTCPVVQASSHIVRWDLQSAVRNRIISPVVDIGSGNLESEEFLASCQCLANSLGRETKNRDWRAAHRAALRAQTEFEQRCREIGRRALEFCSSHQIPAVVVLGRPYTIYNKVLNSNVPALLREQGAMAIPLDCYPLGDATPAFRDIYWGSAQRILRAAHQVRTQTGVYSVYCSNYSCGPDSFALHFYSYIMRGKPMAVIETDGHSGDAGTKTRLEAFLYCLAEHRRAEAAGLASGTPDLASSAEDLDVHGIGFADLRPGEQLVLPYMGPSSEIVAACLRGIGCQAQTLLPPTAKSAQVGRRFTSGKECLPMCLTLGTLVEFLQNAKPSDGPFVFVMPGTRGPCRFGAYNLLNQITLKRNGWQNRIRIWAPTDTDYFAGTPAGFSMLLFTALTAADLLLEALHYVRPAESRPGAAQEIYSRYHSDLLRLVHEQAHAGLSLGRSLRHAATGQLFDIVALLDRAAADFSAACGHSKLPTVLVVGEIYVRLTPSANDFIIDKLEARGCRVRLAPLGEWLDYCDDYARKHGQKKGLSNWLSFALQRRIRGRTTAAFNSCFQWPSNPDIHDTLAASASYLPEELSGEAVLTLGGSAYEWRAGTVDAVISVGPHECMPNKIAEAQFFHMAEQEGLLSLTLPFSGDPVDSDIIDNFVFEVHARFKKNRGLHHGG